MKITGKTIKKGCFITVKAILIGAAVCILSAACAGFVWVKRVIEGAPDIQALSFRPQGFATMIYDREGNVTEKLVMEGANREEASYEEFPEDLKNAFIAIEDERFWENNGIDIRAIARAVKGVITKDSSAGGGSTITQQLIKNSVFHGGQEKTFRKRLERKIQEQYLAVELTKRSDKKTILTDYLNTINLGSNTLGVKVAARRYFNKDLKDLTLSECAVLAGITKNPSRLNPITGAEENALRRARILDKMEEQGMITGKEKEEALKDDVYSRIQNVDVETRSEATPYSYFTDRVIEEVTEAMTRELGYSKELARKMIYSGGLSIYTTQDPVKQNIVDEEINDQKNYAGTLWSMDYRLTISHEDGSRSYYSEHDVEAFVQAGLKREDMGLYTDQDLLYGDIEAFKAHLAEEGGQIEEESVNLVPQPQASFVLLNQFTGEVLAISGGRGEKKASRTFNRATDSLRQPGSVFKVLTAFAPALDGKNKTLATVYYDGLYQAGKKEFRNWYGRYYGYSNIREAIAYSMNIVAVRCMMETVSPQLGVWYARNLGITTLSEQDYNSSTALGGITDGVSNLELTAAFGAIGAGGVYVKPVFFTKVLDHDGNVLLERKEESHRALGEETAFLLTDAMKDVLKGGSKFAVTTISPTGRRAALSSMPAAGKSGTTTGSKDLWFVGYTPYYTAGIWSGNDDGQPVKGGTSYHKDIWKRIMDRVHEGLENKGFETPAGVSKSYVCRKSGKLAMWGVCDKDPRGNAIYSEYFAADTAPKTYCHVHIKEVVCTESGGLATTACPQREEKVFLLVPENGGDTEDSRFAPPPVCPLHPEEESSEAGDEGQDPWEGWDDGMGNDWEDWTEEDWEDWPWQEPTDWEEDLLPGGSSQESGPQGGGGADQSTWGEGEGSSPETTEEDRPDGTQEGTYPETALPEQPTTGQPWQPTAGQPENTEGPAQESSSQEESPPSSGRFPFFPWPL